MNPLIRIWSDPRGTISDLTKSRPLYLFYPLAVIYGIVWNLNKIFQRGINPSRGVGKYEILSINIVVGAIFGIVSIFIASYLLSWIGRLFGGLASPKNIRTVLAWSAAPQIPLLFVILILAVVGPSDFLLRDGGGLFFAAGESPWVFGVLLYIGLGTVVGILWCVINVVGLSEVQGFTIGKSVVSLLLVGLIVFGASLGVERLFAQFVAGT